MHSSKNWNKVNPCLCKVILVFIIVVAFFGHHVLKKHKEFTMNDPYLYWEKVLEYDIDAFAIDSIRADCGELCNTSRAGLKTQYFDQMESKVNCYKLFNNEYTYRQWEKPAKIPKVFEGDFTMNGMIPIYNKYFESNSCSKKQTWTTEEVNKMIKLAQRKTLSGPHGKRETKVFIDGLSTTEGISNGRVLVMSDETPWIEAGVLAAGAKQIVSVVPISVSSHHSQIQTITQRDFSEMYKNKSIGTFDSVVSFGTIEHIGLGRYCDALNPWGDIISLAKAWCVTKESGSLLLGVSYDWDNEHIQFNAGRWYGKVRYPYLVSNWKLTYKGSGKKPIHVYDKMY